MRDATHCDILVIFLILSSLWFSSSTFRSLKIRVILKILSGIINFCVLFDNYFSYDNNVCVYRKKNPPLPSPSSWKWSLTPSDNRAGWRAAVFMRELLPVSRVSDLHLLQRFRNGAALSSVIPTNYTTILIKYELRAPDVPALLVHCKIHVTATTERVSALLNLTKASGIK